MAQSKTLQDDYINSWKNMYGEFTMRKCQMNTIAVLNKIHQKNKEGIREYISWFTEAAIEVSGSNKGMKCWIFEK